MKTIIGIVGVSLVLLGGGCATQQETGTLTGAAVGGVTGTVLGNQLGHGAARGRSQVVGGLVGAGLGAVVGNQIGQNKDFQAQQEAQQASNQAQIQQLHSQANQVTVNVKNSNGSVTPVTLTKHGTGYMGPRGEFYESLPTADQLKVYGF